MSIILTQNIKKMMFIILTNCEIRMGSRGKDSRYTSNLRISNNLPGLFEEDDLQGFSQNISKTKGNIGIKNALGSSVGASLLGQAGDIALKKCMCCGQKTLSKGSVSEICPICGWQDDEYQNRHPDYSGGSNHISLNEAKAAWAIKKAFSGKQKN
jgi:hypothetical protein